MSTKQIARFGMLTAVALALGYMEQFIPIAPGIPGIKLGLSNTVLLYALYMLGMKGTVTLMVLKVLLSGLLFAGVQGMMFSFAGGFVSLLVMILLSKLKDFSVVGVSVGGGVGHNVGQIIVAIFMVQTRAVVSYLPVLLVSGVVTGVLTGVAARQVIKALGRYGE